MKKKTAVIISTFIFGTIMFILVLKFIGSKNLFLSFREFSLFPFLAYILVSFFMRSLCVYRWKAILRAHGFRVPFWTLFSYHLSGYSLSYITPGALIGGEALRAYLLKRNKVGFTKGLSSVIIDKFFDLATATLFTSIGIVLLISALDMSNYYKSIILLVSIIWIVALSFFLYSSLTRKGFFRHIFRFLQLNRFKSLRKFEKKIEETEKHMSHFFIHHKKTFRRCAVLSLLLWFFMFAEYKIATVVFGYEADLIAIFLIICMVGFSYIFPVPGALGILEVSQASMHLFIGLKAAQGIALSLLIRIRDIAWTLLGISFIYRYGINLARRLSGSKK